MPTMYRPTVGTGLPVPAWYRHRYRYRTGTGPVSRPSGLTKTGPVENTYTKIAIFAWHKSHRPLLCLQCRQSGQLLSSSRLSQSIFASTMPADGRLALLVLLSCAPMRASHVGHEGVANSSVEVIYSLQQGSEGCSCIDPWERGLAINGHAPRSNGTDGGSCDWERTWSSTRVRECFSREFGSTGCSRHDLNTSECVAASPPPWCSKRWCFVSPDSCDRPMERSSFFPEATILINGTFCGDAPSGPTAVPLYFSYGTCGFLDAFTTSSLERFRQLREFAARQRNGGLRIAFPYTDSGSGTSIVGIDDFPAPRGGPKVPPGGGVGGTNRSGSVLVFMDNILRRGAVPWVEVPVSDASRAYSSSSFTACVHEVAIGGADVSPTCTPFHYASLNPTDASAYSDAHV